MPKPALQLMIGDKELRAIGHVAAQWAYLETQLDTVTELLIEQPAAAHLGLRQSQSFQRRMECLRVVAKVVLLQQADELDELLSIAADASSLRGYRDDIIHGEWKLHRKGARGTLTTGMRVLSQRPTRILREIPFSAAKVERVACKIAATTLRLIVWTERNVRDS